MSHASPTPYEPRRIDNLFPDARLLRDEIFELQRLWYDAITRRIYGHRPFRYPDGRERLACDIEHEIEEKNEALNILISELDRRRI